MKIKTAVAGCLFLSMLYISCNRTSKEITNNESVKTESAKPVLKNEVKKPTNEAFEPFYQKFHRDSIFQMSRIKFPMEGYATDTSAMPVKWNRNNWLMHRSTVQMVDTNLYKVEKELHNTYYKEKIYIEGSGFSVERIFKKINGKWYLISYIDEDV